MSRDFSQTLTVSIIKVYELKPPKNSTRTYLMIDNQSAAIKFDFGMTPNNFSGEVLPSGGRYERNLEVSQSTINIVGTLSTLQNVNVVQAFRDDGAQEPYRMPQQQQPRPLLQPLFDFFDRQAAEKQRALQHSRKRDLKSFKR